MVVELPAALWRTSAAMSAFHAMGGIGRAEVAAVRQRLLSPLHAPFVRKVCHDARSVAKPEPARVSDASAPKPSGKRPIFSLMESRTPRDESRIVSVEASNPALAFPCLDAQDARQEALQASQDADMHDSPQPRRPIQSGPEPSYTSGIHQTWRSTEPLQLDWGGRLPVYNVAYETWGSLNADRSNAILLHTGLSASSHAHSTATNPAPGWWEKFIGPGAPLDTERYFIICTNVLGGCYGSTGPGSIDPADGKHYATRFPIVTIEDMVRGQFGLLDALGIDRVFASVGCSMGGMQSLAAAVLEPERVGRIVTVSGCARSHPYSIAMRHTQRQVLMMDPNWNRGFYYAGGVPPHAGMKLAREIATVTYRSGPEWEHRFGRRRAEPSRPPALCPDFLIETYLDHAGEKFCLEYDANSLLYVSKAMDLFDLGHQNQLETRTRRGDHGRSVHASFAHAPPAPEKRNDKISDDLVQGLQALRKHPILVMGVASDILFPAWQQREIADTLKATGNKQVQHVELGQDVSLFGHDTFLLDLKHVGGSILQFLDQSS